MEKFRQPFIVRTVIFRVRQFGAVSAIWFDFQIKSDSVGTPTMAFARSVPILSVNLSKKGLPHPLAEVATPYVHRLLGFEQFNLVYSQLPQCEPEDFSRTF